MLARRSPSRRECLTWCGSRGRPGSPSTSSSRPRLGRRRLLTERPARARPSEGNGRDRRRPRQLTPAASGEPSGAPGEASADADEHADELFGELVCVGAGVVVDDVFLGDERREVVEKGGLVVLDEEKVGVLLVVEHGALVGVEPAAPVPGGGVGCDRRQVPLSIVATSWTGRRRW